MCPRRITNASASTRRPSASVRQPRRAIRTHRHLALIQHFQMLGIAPALSGEPRTQSRYDPPRSSASTRPGLLRCAAINTRPQIQPAMLAMHPRAQGLDSRRTGVPDPATRNRTATSPTSAIPISRAQLLERRRRQFIVRQQPRLAERRADSPGTVGRDVGSRRGVAHVGSGGCRSRGLSSTVEDIGAAGQRHVKGTSTGT